MDEENQKQKVLIIGGTNFMGKELAQRLAADPTIDLHCINRGKLHW
jgi:nucleoside-diphosphate-sugar epimerase